MPRIIAVSLGRPGHVFPFVPLLSEFRSRGHDVHLLLCARGMLNSTFGGIETSIIPYGAAEGADGRASTRSARRVEAIAFARRVAEAIRSHEPDCLIVDPYLWGAMLAARGSGLPWASLASTPLSFRAQGLDVRGPGLRPPTTALSRAFHHLVYEWLRYRRREKVRLVNAVCADLGQSGLRTLDALLSEPTLILATTVEPFEPVRTDWPKQLRFVGPLLWELPPPADWSFTPPSDGRPLILVVGSSIPDPPSVPDWAGAVVRALGEEPYYVVATLPTGTRPDRPPVNTFVAEALPHMEVLRHTSCVVCHGAPGIVDKALAQGVPVVCIPYGIDRYEVARRVEMSGVGIRLPLRRLSRQTIVAAVRSAVSEPVRTRAREMAAVLNAGGGARRAADEVERMLCASNTSQ